MDAVETSGKNISWSAPEYEERERSSDWFWALGIIAVTAALTAIIYRNYFFAILILLSGGLLYMFAHKSPEWIDYELTEKGLRIKARLYLYENIFSFWVQRGEKPLLFVKTERFFIPIISIPINADLAPEIREKFLEKDVPEEEMVEHVSEKIMDFLGF